MISDAAKAHLSFFKRPFFLWQIKKIGNRVYEPVSELKAEVAVTSEPVPYEKRLELKYREIKRGEVWTKNVFDCAWFHFTGKITGNREDAVAIIRLDGEGCVVDDDGVVQGLTSVMSVGDFFQPVAGKSVVGCEKLNIDADGNIDVWVDAGKNGGILGASNGGSKLKEARIARVRRDILDFYYDVLILSQYAANIKGGERKEIVEKLNRAMNIVRDFSAENVKKAAESIAPYYSGGNKHPFEITAVGHAHLDLAWLWPMRETIRKSARTYSNALAQIEKHPDYVFGSSQPQQFLWMKERQPSLYEKIKKAVAEGTIEPQGVMWCEPDTNLPSGESLIRQCYYGKRFFKDEFGVDMDYLWVPDVFGYSASLPRILTGSGVDKFMTIKLSWNNINKFPYHSFVWKGIGEGKVLVHMPPEGDYNSQTNPYVVRKIARVHREAKVSPLALMPFGCGDGGGGPGEYHVNSIERQSKLNVKDLPRIKFGTAEEFFKRLERDIPKLPTYEGELYFEKHQGTYTTQGRMKRDMRKAETELHNAEFLCAQASLKGYEYPTRQLDKIWRTILLHQFHDILPGSSITRVYDDAKVVFEGVRKELSEIEKEAFGFLNGNELSVINPTSFSRKGYIKHENSWYEYNAAPYSAVVPKAFEHADFAFDTNTIENNLCKVVFNKNGEIVGLIDKADGENAVGKTFNTMRVYTDKRMIPYDAWDIDIKYTKKRSRRMRLVETNSYIDGARVVREQVFVYNDSTLKQTIYLYNDCPCVFVDNHADWHENHKMLRADFYPKHYSKTVKCDIQMGSFDRSTTNKNSVEYAQFEICAHKWVDVSDGKGGFSLLNDCKYGHRVKDGIISLNLLRAPVYPDKTADRHEHDFTYAMYPHKGGAFDSDLIKYGYELNYPVICGYVEPFPTVAAVDNKAVIVETISKTPDGKIMIRLYEDEGAPQNASLSVGFDYKRVTSSNLVYENEILCDITKLEFTPFEIKTLLFEL